MCPDIAEVESQNQLWTVGLENTSCIGSFSTVTSSKKTRIKLEMVARQSNDEGSASLEA
jgi:hypothetical protein